MAKSRLKDVMEAVGVISIVASLLFLAIQVRQAQQVAIAETDAALLESGLQVLVLVSEHAEVWERGSKGEELSEPEAVVFQNLVQAYNDLAYTDYRRKGRLNPIAAAGELHDFAAFLHRNPGARRAWLAREDDLVASRRLLEPGLDDFSDWRDGILKDLNTLDAR